MLSFFLLCVPTTIAKPIVPISLAEDQYPSVSVRNAHLPIPNTLSPYVSLTKRDSAAFITRGWSFILSSADHFNHVHSAASALNDFYQYALESLYEPRNTGVLTRAISISDPTFELIFHIRDAWRYPNAQLDVFLVRQFVTLMRYRAQRGLAAQYRGWLQGPGGIIVDVVMSTIPAAILLDSAMDMYGDR
ncbi:MAG: hypothetical protein Q9172_003094 [Xanthocarpia lactea]